MAKAYKGLLPAFKHHGLPSFSWFRLGQEEGEVDDRKKMMGFVSNLCVCSSLLVSAASALSIAQLTGTKYLSPYKGQAISNVTGIVTGKTSSGLFIQGLRRACDRRVADGVYVYSSSLAKNASIVVGDIITVNGFADQYRSDPNYLYLLEIGSPKVTSIVKGGTLPKPLVIGKDTLSPPTEQFSGLDGGDIFGVPNNRSLISVVNPTLEPDKYGMDFWQSLNGELVTIQEPVAIGKPNQYAETWIVGNWATTGRNARGGLTLGSKGSSGSTDPFFCDACS